MSENAASVVGQPALALGCQIIALRQHIIRQTSAFSAEELAFLLSHLKVAEMAVGEAFGRALTGRAA